MTWEMAQAVIRREALSTGLEYIGTDSQDYLESFVKDGVDSVGSNKPDEAIYLDIIWMLQTMAKFARDNGDDRFSERSFFWMKEKLCPDFPWC